MKKIDFRKILVENIEGIKNEADVSKQLGNQMYMQGQNIEECELGRAIYHKGSVELDSKQADMVRRFIQPWSYVLRSAIENTLLDD